MTFSNVIVAIGVITLCNFILINADCIDFRPKPYTKNSSCPYENDIVLDDMQRIVSGGKLYTSSLKEIEKIHDDDVLQALIDIILQLNFLGIKISIEDVIPKFGANPNTGGAVDVGKHSFTTPPNVDLTHTETVEQIQDTVQDVANNAEDCTVNFIPKPRTMDECPYENDFVPVDFEPIIMDGGALYTESLKQVKKIPDDGVLQSLIDIVLRFNNLGMEISIEEVLPKFGANVDKGGAVDAGQDSFLLQTANMDLTHPKTVEAINKIVESVANGEV